MIKKRVIVAGLLLLILTTMPLVQATTEQFSNSVVLITGKCNTVTTNALWLFGLKFMIHRKVTIQASGQEGEKIHALVLPPTFGVFFGHENIIIQMEGATGLFFWGGKSLLLQQSSQRVFVFCKAGDMWITYD
jgi:hypothetical protein